MECMIKSGLFLPGHRLPRRGDTRFLRAIVAAAALLGLLLGSSLSMLVLRVFG
jgi:hypothetical protein